MTYYCIMRKKFYRIFTCMDAIGTLCRDVARRVSTSTDFLCKRKIGVRMKKKYVRLKKYVHKM